MRIGSYIWVLGLFLGREGEEGVLRVWKVTVTDHSILDPITEGWG